MTILVPIHQLCTAKPPATSELCVAKETKPTVWRHTTVEFVTSLDGLMKMHLMRGPLRSAEKRIAGRRQHLSHCKDSIIELSILLLPSFACFAVLYWFLPLWASILTTVSCILVWPFLIYIIWSDSIEAISDNMEKSLDRRFGVVRRTFHAYDRTCSAVDLLFDDT